MRYPNSRGFRVSAPCKMAFIWEGAKGHRKGYPRPCGFANLTERFNQWRRSKKTRFHVVSSVTLLGTTTAGLTLLSMTGCGGGGGEDAATSGSTVAGDPVKGGTFKVALNRTISAKSLDPLYVDSTTADQVCQNYGDTLVQENFDQSEYLPCIATKWDISEDGKVYTFTIRDDVHFQPASSRTAAC